MFRCRRVWNLFKHKTFAIAALAKGRNDIKSHEDDNFSPLHVPDLEQAKASCRVSSNEPGGSWGVKFKANEIYWDMRHVRSSHLHVRNHFLFHQTRHNRLSCWTFFAFSSILIIGEIAKSHQFHVSFVFPSITIVFSISSLSPVKAEVNVDKC